MPEKRGGCRGEHLSLRIAAVLMSIVVMSTTVMAADIGVDSDQNTTVRVEVRPATPKIQWAKLLDSSWNEVDNTQIDVKETYYFVINVTALGGWEHLEYVNVTAWYDREDESFTPSEPITMNNTQVRFTYRNTTGTGVFYIAWSGNGEFTLGTCSETYINQSGRILNISFTPNEQVRWAVTNHPVWIWGAGFDDPNSWNFRVNATNDLGNVSQNYDSEFGIYMYSEIGAVNDPQGTGLPNQHISLDANGATVVTYHVNDDFRLSVKIQNLTGPDTIGADNVSVYGGDIGTPTNFPGADQELWLYGSASTLKAAPESGTVQSFETHWAMDIPNVLSGTYSSTVTYTISQV